MLAPPSPEGDRLQPVLTATGIHKTFDRTHALAGASFELRTGEVHGLLGANGAGKSTLSKIISGHVIRDSGEIHYKGRSLELRTTREALDAGIAIVMQETSLAPDLSVLENIFLPELGRWGRLSYSSMRRRATDLLASLGHEHALPLDHRSLAPLGRPAPAGRDRQGAGARGRPHHLRRAHGIAQPHRGGAALRHHGQAARHGPCARLRVAPAGGGVRDHRPRDDPA